MSGKVVVKASKIKRDKKIVKIIKILLLVIILLLIGAYVAVSFIYNNGHFTVSLDKNLYLKNQIIVYDDPEYKVYRSELFAKGLDYFDNISYKWLPNNLDKTDGSHNGDNYIAYTFYVENTGENKADYWTEIVIEEVVKNVDKAIRVKLYKNGKYETYAKLGLNGKPEKNTIPFKDAKTIAVQKVKDFKPKAIDKYTMVIWLEGSDPDCNNNILGGEIKVNMHFNSELKKK